MGSREPEEYSEKPLIAGANAPIEASCQGIRRESLVVSGYGRLMPWLMADSFATPRL